VEVPVLGQGGQTAVISHLGENLLHNVDCDCGRIVGDYSCCTFSGVAKQIIEGSVVNPRLIEEWEEILYTISCSFSVMRSRAYTGNDRDTPIEDKIFFDKVSRHVAYRMLKVCTDRDLLKILVANGSTFEHALQFLSLAYEVRTLMGDSSDWGFKANVDAFRGQGQSVSTVLKRLFGYPDEGMDPNVTVTEFVSNLCSHYWSQIKQFIAFLSSTVMNAVETAFKGFVVYLCQCMFGEFTDKVLNLVDNTQRLVITSSVLFGIWVVVRLMQIVTDNVAHAIFDLSVRGATSLFGTYAPQGPLDLMALVGSLCLTIIGLGEKDFSRVKRYAQTMIALMAGGTVLASVFKTLLMLLPPVLKMAITYRFGTSDDRLEYDIEQWRSVSMSICAVSRVQSIIGNKNYAEKVKEQLLAGGDLIRLCSNSTKPCLKQVLIQTYVKLVNIHSQLVTRERNSGDRRLPFAFHMCGPPGIGKTATVRDLLIKSCGMSYDDIYNKDMSDEFWSGYLDHRVIVMDEFLVDVTEANFDRIKSYLTMVSTAEWRPPFASVDDPMCGIKGSTCRPEIVVTMNNHPYTHVDHIVNAAYQRRRRFVVTCGRSERYIAQKHNDLNVDMRAYTPQELAERAWMTFSILPAMACVNPVPIKEGLTYLQLVEFIKLEYEEHEELCKMISRDMNASVMEERSVDDILQEVLRDAYSIPSAPVSIAEALQGLLPTTLVGQGPVVEFEDIAMNEISSFGELGTRITSTCDSNETILQRILNRLRNLPFKRSVSFLAVCVVVLATFASGMLRGEAHTDDTFCGQSERKEKSSVAKRSRKPFQRGSRIKAQGPNFATVTISLNGMKFHAIPICGRKFLTYSHAIDLDAIDETSFWRVNFDGMVYEHPANIEDVVFCADDDVAIISIDCLRMPQSKDIVKSFISHRDMDGTVNAQVLLDTGEKRMTSVIQHHLNMRYVVGTKVFKLDKAMKYRAPTELGDCGIPIRIMSGGLVNKIAGIHVAGTGLDALEPMGVATFVTQEMLFDALQEFVPAVGQGPHLCGPNLVSQRPLACNERVAFPATSKIRKSDISGLLSVSTKKAPAIMSLSDPRSKGVDPVDKSLQKLCSIQSPEMDDILLDRVTDTLIDRYCEKLSFPGGVGPLTFESACSCIPAFLNSITTSTSPGYPLVHLQTKRGKTDFVWFEGSELKYSPMFRDLVEQRVAEMRSFNGGPIDHRFIGYLKDELVKASKIEDVRTRMTYANDVVSIVAFRMVFGTTFAAFMNSFEATGFAVGLNQYSEDMDGIHTYLTSVGTRMSAGDYESFDQRYVKKASDAAYKIFCAIAMKTSGVSAAECAYLVQHETASPIQVRDTLLTVKVGNKSGCFLTTPVNCIMNNIYVRYCFMQKYGAVSFDDNVRMVVLGDDVVICISDRIEMTPKELSGYMTGIGQVYTSAFKDRDLTYDYETFDGLTFLGSIPRVGLS